jgi:hypothetical protein
VDAFLTFLVDQGWAGLAMAGVGWAFVQERNERRAAQAALDAARQAHSDALLLVTKENTAAFNSLEQLVRSHGPRGTRNG